MESRKDRVRNRELLCAAPGDKVMDVICTMAKAKIGAVPVVSGGRLAGIFSERDLLARVICQGKDPAATTLEEVMTREVISAHPTEKIGACLAKMQDAGCRHMPIVAAGELIGMVSLLDLLALLLEDVEDRLSFLQQYALGAAVRMADFELTWICEDCGHRSRSEQPPKSCPGCSSGAQRFRLSPERPQ